MHVWSRFCLVSISPMFAESVHVSGPCAVWGRGAVPPISAAHTQQIKQDARPSVCARLGPSRCTPALSPCDNYSWPGSRPWHLVYAKCGVRGWELQRGVILGLLADTNNIEGSPRRNLINPSYSAVVVLAGKKPCYKRPKNVNIGPCLFKDKIIRIPHIISLFVHLAY